MVKYKLHYFDVAGRAEPIHFRFKKEDWPTIKSNYIFGQVPVLEVDGKQLAQCGAIMQFLGKRFDLAGKNEWEEAKAMEIIFLNDEMGYAVEPYIDAMFGFHEGNVVCSNTDKCL
uniref:glutathione transferase n=1 Tax=Meloidogyne enterolobii TaxID=390850 RepID=A0A6V7WQZ6_MELEN|nr:unnamed protein product [Meloidogyne enterolobii]